MANPPRSMALAMSMALPTPPNSGKEEIMHSFSPQRYSDDDPPLFGPLMASARRSPSDVAMMRGQTANDGIERKSRQNTTQKQTLPTLAPLFGPISPNSERLPTSPPRRKPAVSTHDSRLRPEHEHPSRSSPSQPAELQRTKSAFSPEEIDLLADFTDRFPRTFKVEAPFLKIRKDPKGKTWLDLPGDLGLSIQRVPSPQGAQLPRGHKRKDSGLGDSPQKRAANLPASKRRQATPKARAGTPKETHGTQHIRKRSTLSETHSTKGDNRPTRQAAYKPKVSTDFRDWPDFTPLHESLDNDHARTIAARFDLGLVPKIQDTRLDPIYEELHDVELEIVRKACIDPRKYMFAKRSVFVGYLKHLLYEDNKRPLTPLEATQGLKSWNKTAAQVAGHIDVNKISKLFEHFWSQVGWFDRKHFEHFLLNHEQLVFPEFDPSDGRLLVEGGLNV